MKEVYCDGQQTSRLFFQLFMSVTRSLHFFGQLWLVVVIVLVLRHSIDICFIWDPFIYLVGREYWCTYAKEGLPMDGPCGQKCICLDGILQYCCRQRKNFASMTRAERLLYVNTVIKASTDRRYRRQYNRLIGLHKRLFNRGIHDREEFLPWHRW